MSAVEVAPSAAQADAENEAVIAVPALLHPKSYCTKKETGRLGPVSGASVEMRLHRSLAPLTQRNVRARFTSAGASRASQGSEERGNVTDAATVGPVSDSVQWFQLFL
jgi:hypothetical protein